MTLTPCPNDNANMLKVETVLYPKKGFRVVCEWCGKKGPLESTERLAIHAWNWDK